MSAAGLPMGCGASSSGAAVPAPRNDVTARPAATEEEEQPSAAATAAEEDLRSCWAAVAGGGVEATLSPVQVRGVLEELGKRLSDEEFAAAFKAMDTNGSGEIEFPEFVNFYNTSTVADKTKIRALRAHQELLRRLESGSLTPDEERLVRQRLCLPASSADSTGLQGTAEEGKEAATVTQQSAQKVSQQKQMATAANELDPDPATLIGRMVVLELQGGNDKQKKGAGSGHRRDTFPICNAVKRQGWGCEVAVYSAADHAAVAALCESADGIIVRAAQGEPGVFGEAGPSKLYDLLEALVDMYGARSPKPALLDSSSAR